MWISRIAQSDRKLSLIMIMELNSYSVQCISTLVLHTNDINTECTGNQDDGNEEVDILEEEGQKGSLKSLVGVANRCGVNEQRIWLRSRALAGISFSPHLATELWG